MRNLDLVSNVIMYIWKGKVGDSIDQGFLFQNNGFAEGIYFTGNMRKANCLLVGVSSLLIL